MDTNKKSDVIYHDIGMQHTRINNMFRNMNILKGEELKAAIRRGEITVGTKPVTRAGQKVNVGQVVRYCDYEIRVRGGSAEAANAASVEMFRSGGYKGTSYVRRPF